MYNKVKYLNMCFRMDFSTLNRIAMSAYLPRKSLSDLEKEHKYAVTNLKQVSTRFGHKVVATLDEAFDVFLSERVSKAMESNHVLFEEMSAKAQKYELYIVYHGDNKFEFVCN